MSFPSHRVARCHLKLAYVPARVPPAPSRAAMLARAVIVRFRVFILNIVAMLGALRALVPLLLHPRPLGHRTQVPRRRVARVIPLQPRSRAAPR